MNLERLKFGLMYRLGFVPWDGHKLPARLVELVEGKSPLTPSKAIDLGCGTGDSAIYLAAHGWEVVGVDFVERALATARAKADAAHANVRWVRADVIQLRAAEVGSGFRLLVDNGCIHLLSADARARYVEEVTAIAAPDARFIVTAFLPGRRGPGPSGIDQAEIERRFAPGWRLLGSGPTDWTSPRGETLYCYDLERA